MNDVVIIIMISGVVLNASSQIITVFTPTPDPATKIGKIYRVIEICAGLVGKAKQAFVPASTPDSNLSQPQCCMSQTKTTNLPVI